MEELSNTTEGAAGILSWDEIKKALEELQYTQRRLAKRWRMSESTVSRFLKGELKSDNCKRLLAKTLGIEQERIPQAERCPTCHQALNHDTAAAG